MQFALLLCPGLILTRYRGDNWNLPVQENQGKSSLSLPLSNLLLQQKSFLMSLGVYQKRGLTFQDFQKSRSHVKDHLLQSLNLHLTRSSSPQLRKNQNHVLQQKKLWRPDGSLRRMMSPMG